MYKSGEFGYVGKTDSLGRIESMQTPTLKPSTAPRRRHHRRTPGKQSGDHAGHIFGDRFGGSRDLDNLVSQTSGVNLSVFKTIENRWAEALAAGKKVEVAVNVKYAGNSLRPSEFEVIWKINGRLRSRIITNN